MPQRNKLPEERRAIIHKFRMGETKVYLTVGLYEDGKPGEIFLREGKTGDQLRGLLNTVSVLFSIALQRGVPLKELADKMEGNCFEPAGLTRNQKIPIAKSVVDYVARWLKLKFPEPEPLAAVIGVGQFRKKPVVIEAIHFDGSNHTEVLAFCPVAYRNPYGITIPTAEGDMQASVGDWIIKGVKGEFYPCKPEIFEETYSRA